MTHVAFIVQPEEVHEFSLLVQKHRKQFDNGSTVSAAWAKFHKSIIYKSSENITERTFSYITVSQEPSNFTEHHTCDSRE